MEKSDSNLIEVTAQRDAVEEIEDEKKKSHKGMQVFFISFAVSFVVLMCAFLVFFIVGSSASRRAGVDENNVPYYNDYQPLSQENINVLIIGTEKSHLPPSFVLLYRYDAVGKQIVLTPLSVDALATVDGEERSLLEWYDYENIRGCTTAVECLTGVKVDRYIRVEDKGIANLVDYLGGIECNIKQSIQYRDIIIAEGEQLLDGRRVSTLLCSEQNEQIKHEVVQAYFAQHFNKGLVGKYSKFVSAFFYNVETNINQYDFAIRQKGLLAGLQNDTICIEIDSKY